MVSYIEEKYLFFLKHFIQILEDFHYFFNQIPVLVQIKIIGQSKFKMIDVF